MTENKNAKTPTDGGEAFPVAHSYLIQPGMSLRDYFAAKAMQGFIDYAAATGRFAPPDDQLAKCSYDVADAMLKARER